MFHEYALDPAVLSNWERVRYFLDAFGPWTGRFLSEYPRRKWKKLVYDSLQCGDVERKRVEERLQRLDGRIFSPVRRSTYDVARGWHDNAAEEHQRRAFHAIIGLGVREGAHFLDASSLDSSEPLWHLPQGRMMSRDPAVVAQALAFLLGVSSRIVLIDPYFRADKYAKAASVVAFCNVMGDRSAALELHFSELGATHAFCVSAAQRVLPQLLPLGRPVTLHCWKERAGGPRLHNRYLLTEIGGVQFGDGIERGDPGQDDRVSILEERSHAELWSQYAGTAVAFDRVAPPVSIVGKVVQTGGR
jgi:hypothetical protein